MPGVARGGGGGGGGGEGGMLKLQFDWYIIFKKDRFRKRIKNKK